MHDILAKPAAIATCGLFNMKRRAKEALPAQGSIEWVVIVVCIAVALIAALVYLSNQMNIKLNKVSATLQGTDISGAHTPQQ
jgi:Flp pilus assembly pilin Flp